MSIGHFVNFNLYKDTTISVLCYLTAKLMCSNVVRCKFCSTTSSLYDNRETHDFTCMNLSAQVWLCLLTTTGNWHMQISSQLAVSCGELNLHKRLFNFSSDSTIRFPYRYHSLSMPLNEWMNKVYLYSFFSLH